MRITQLLVLNEQHLQAKHRVRRLTAYNAVLQTESAAEGTTRRCDSNAIVLRYDASTSEATQVRHLLLHTVQESSANKHSYSC